MIWPRNRLSKNGLSEVHTPAPVAERRRGTLRGALIILVATSVASVAIAQSLSPPEWTASPSAGAARNATAERQNSRIREGTEIRDQLGYFRLTGHRVTFFGATDENRLIVLENLNLERVAQIVAENPVQLVWSVSGTVTEFKGDNYLLLSRAVLANPEQSRPARAPR